MGPVPPLWGIWLEPKAWGEAFWPVAAALVIVVGVAYARGVARQHRAIATGVEHHVGGAGRSGAAGEGVAWSGGDRPGVVDPRVVEPSVVATPGRQVLFYLGLAIIAFAILSPLDVLSQWLFSAHMIQHLLLLVVAPPLLVASAPLDPLWRAVPAALHRRLADGVSWLFKLAPLRRAGALVMSPWGAFTVLAGTMWFWHVPGPYDLTLSNLYVHALEHTMFLGAGLLWWSRIISCPPLRAPLSASQASMPTTMAFMFATIGQNVLLAMVIGFAAHPLYAPYAALAHRPGGISALADQQLGASFMWTIGDLPFSIALARLVFLWMSGLEAEDVAGADQVPGAVPVTAPKVLQGAKPRVRP
ncbi:MAG: cytochrome c oxidase assembly protein [Actinobacteria bacterium]|nr:cytochrome c oxidase assembly protein [Actinomycetota bacterium]